MFKNSTKSKIRARMSQMSHSNSKWLIEISKRWLLNFNKINVSAFSGRRRQRWSDIMSPTVLKSLSDRTLVGVGARTFCASGDNWGDLCMFIFHQEAGSSWRLMSGSDKNWSNSALIKVTIGWHVLKYCVETIPETVSCLLVHRLFTTAHRDGRFPYKVQYY